MNYITLVSKSGAEVKVPDSFKEQFLKNGYSVKRDEPKKTRKEVDNG